MKTRKTAWLFIILISISFQLEAQFSDKNSTQKGNGGTGSLEDGSMNKTTFTTSRLEDIQEMDKYQKMVQVAVESNNGIEAEVYKNQALVVMVNEIARAKNNLNQLKAGDTKHLIEYQKEHAPNYPVSVSREIQNLTNRINYETQVYNVLKSRNLTKPANERDFSSAPGYINGFKKAMERNLRYESDEKTVVIPGSENKGGGKIEGPAIITKGGSKEKIDEGDPRLQSWESSKQQRKKEFIKNQADFTKYANSGDNNMAKRSYKTLTQLMMDEVNSSRWMIGQVTTSNIKSGNIDTDAMASNVEKQQTILKEAQKVKVSFPDDLKANKAKAIELIGKFANTL